MCRKGGMFLRENKYPSLSEDRIKRHRHRPVDHFQ